MNQIVNTEIVISARKFLISEFKKPKIDLSSLKVYSYAHPLKNLPDTFILVKTVGALRDVGNLNVNGHLEVCVYAKNLVQEEDQSQPSLSVINNLTKKVLSILDDAIFDNTAIVSLSPTLVSDPDIKYFYNSIICETVNIKSTN